MFAHDFLLQLPPGPVLLVLSSIFSTAQSHAVPRQTKTVAYTELDVLPWPLPTPGPRANALLERQLNTICGYIGGDPDLPATCSAGSHCAVDVGHGVIGCCPDGGSCTAGLYTGCVDSNSDPQTEINPYVFTCGGRDVCYQNRFDGGYFQYGCGSSSDMAATVVASASDRDAVEITTISVDLTAEASTLSEPTTIGTKRTSRTTDTLSTERTTSSTTARDESSTTSEPTATSTDDELDAPREDDDGPNVGAIVGGTIGGVAFFALVAVLALYLIRRRKGNMRQGPQNQGKQYIGPEDENNHAFEPLPSVQEVGDSQLPRGVPPAYAGAGDYVARESLDNRSAEPYASTVSPQGYPTSPHGNHDNVVGGVSPLENDRQPLTLDLDDDFEFHHGHQGLLLGPIQEETREGPVIPGFTETSGPYMPRRGGGGALWQQNRGPQTQNPMWL